MEENTLCFLINAASEADGDSKVNMMAESLRKAAYEYDGHFTIGVGNFYKSINDISFSYSEAIEALNNKFYCGEGVIIRYKEIEPSNRFNKYDGLVNENMFINYVKAKNIDGISKLFHEIVNEIRVNRIEEHFAKQVLNRLVLTVIDSVAHDISNGKNVLPDMESIFNSIKSCGTLDELESTVVGAFCEIIEVLGEKSSNRNIEEIMKYIHDNYHKEISLNSISDMVSLSPSYVSKLFREATGQNFVEYLAMYRINMAKEIMKNENIPVNEVFTRVGFNNIRTFMRTFKKYEGVTPGQFKQS